MEELLERSPTLPRTSKTTIGNDGKSPEKLTAEQKLWLGTRSHRKPERSSTRSTQHSNGSNFAFLN
ncbi:golgin candidate 2 [Dorcoceras hygrometricum]|uniref:Golgin candidate 2 n=1 Tax=Dorcoceras hygrometricum TaxID=472368 RepID=A0A2Z7CB09_9LAMI|nr:golgin candidate 2 [Dorcoceras hygrometricum]